MYLDQNTVLSDKQVITTSAASTNSIDLGAPGYTSYNKTQLKRNLGHLHAPFLVQVDADFATLTSLTVEFQTDEDVAFGSPKVVQSITVGVAELKKGKIIMDNLPLGIKERYLRLYYTVTGSAATTGSITAGVVAAVDGAYRG